MGAHATTTDPGRREVAAAEFRDAMGHFATGVTIVTSVGPDGEPVGTTANAVTSLSLDPPLILVCFDRSSVTFEAICSHGAFAVNVLAAPQQHLSVNFARRGLAAAWDGVGHRRGRTGSPRLDGVLASLECTVEHRIAGGDHEIVVGRVQEVETGPADGVPLLFWRGRYVGLDPA
ncbi:MAG TPA: flavin reductase family protein [Streptosporangiaceae bacterium]